MYVLIIPDRRAVVRNLPDVYSCIDTYAAIRDASGEGVSTFQFGLVFDEEANAVAGEIAYNGRWIPDPRYLGKTVATYTLSGDNLIKEKVS